MEVDSSSKTLEGTNNVGVDKQDASIIATSPERERSVKPPSEIVLDESEQSAGRALNGSGGHRRKRSRRKHKAGKHHNRKWKPYDKLTWEERKQLDERETRRANLKREELFAAGQPMAPYNTTQFLMEQHQGSYERLDMLAGENARPIRHNTVRETGADGGDGGSGSFDSSEDYNQDSPDDEEFLMGEKDFAEAYENFHAERLHSLTKEELVREYLELEAKSELLEKKVKEIGHSPAKNCENTTQPDKNDTELRTEIERLKTENARLIKENDLLKHGPKSV